MTTDISNTADECCPGCGAGSRVLGLVRGAAVLACKDSSCALWFLARQVRPAAERDNGWYEERLLDDQAVAHSALSKMLPMYRRQLQLMAQVTAGRRFVDVGSGQGYFLAAAHSDGWDALGLELSPHGRAFTRTRFGLTAVQQISDIESASVDAVRASHVLEHIPEPKSFLADVARILRPGGVLLVIVPHREPLCEMLVNRVRRWRSELPALTGAVYPDMHVLGFDERALIRSVVQHGLERCWTRTLSMGNRSFYPWWYDDLVQPLSFRSWISLGARYCVPRVVNNLGAAFGRGDWVVGMFRKPIASAQLESKKADVNGGVG